MKVAIPNRPHLPAIGDICVYSPKNVISRYDGKRVKVISVNCHGHITIRFLDGPRQGQTRSVKAYDLNESKNRSEP